MRGMKKDCKKYKYMKKKKQFIAVRATFQGMNGEYWSLDEQIGAYLEYAEAEE